METKQVLKNLLAEAEKQGLNDWYVPIIIRRAFYAGLALDVPTDPLAGYSNLTEAIKAGEPIDWAKLDGKKVQCDNPDVGTNRGELGRNETYTSERSAGWFYKSMDKTYVRSLIDAWRGENGWTLWIEGEIPTCRKRRKTADQLEEYTYFRGKSGSGKTYLLYVGFPRTSDRRNIRYAPSMLKSLTPADEWEVLEEYGTFPKLEDR